MAVAAEIQLAVDKYVELYKLCKETEGKMEALRAAIEPYMQESGLSAIDATDGSAFVSFGVSERPVMNARYTTYELEEVSSFLTSAQRRRCVVEVVDKEKLEALCKLGELPEDILTRRLTRTVRSFSVRLRK
jgi:hypothetical protein